MVAAAKKQQQQQPTTARTIRPTKRPHFFKLLIRDFARRLKLPPRFVGDHLRGSSGAAVVHDAEGGAWNVALERTSSTGAFLSGGWAKFVDDHALREHEFVVFRYDGDMHFTMVMAFDTTECEKDMVSGEVHKGSCQVKEEEEEEVRCFPETSLKKVAVPPRKKSKDDARSGGYIARQHRTTKEERKDVDPIPFLSTFPYFVSRMTPRQVVIAHVLWLPVGFSRAHLPSTKTRLDLHNSDGNVWAVNHITSSRGRGFFSAGWTAFARDNKLRVGDYCAFELVAPAKFNVTVIRGK